MIGSGGKGPRFSYRELGAIIGRLAAGLKKKGVRKGDKVAILSENCPEWGAAYLAILACGAIVTPVDSSLKEGELSRLFRVSDLKAIFCSPRHMDKVKKLIDLNDLGFSIYGLIGEEPNTLRGMLEKLPFYSDNVGLSDTAVLIYTSGTTGDPKGVILTHQNLLSNLNSIARTLPLYENDVFLSVLPMHHTFEATCGFLLPLYTGMTIVFARSLKSKELFSDIAQNKVTVMVGVPLLYEKLYNAINRKIKELSPIKKAALKAFYTASQMGRKLKQNPGRVLFRGLRRKAGLESIRLLVSGGAAIPSRIAEWFNLVGFVFLQGYGMTECSPVVSVNRADDNKFGSVGPPIPGIEVEIDGKSPDGIGEIKVRGGNTTPGYLGNPEATSKLLRDGWLYTGDLGKIENNHLYITGRKKNLIISGGGKNIYPEEIEAELNLSAIILESIVIGRHISGRAGEEIWAIIVPDLEYINETGKPEKAPKEIRNMIAMDVKAVNQRLAAHKRISGFEISLDELEKTTTRKVKRNLYN